MLKDMECHMKYKIEIIIDAIESGQYGATTGVLQDFLAPGKSWSQGMPITRQQNSRRRRCQVIYLDRIAQNLRAQVQEGE